MPRYQCHKQVWALKIKEVIDPTEPGNESDGTRIIVPEEKEYAPFRVHREYVQKHNLQAGGYYVVYADGYMSFSPAEAFEGGYQMIPAGLPTVKKTGLNFGMALEAIKQGLRVCRAGWNGKGMFLFLLPGGKVLKSAIHDPAVRAVMDEQIQGDTFEALGSVRMFTADKKVLSGWLASQSDMLSDDWMILE